jgi:hypothetical protein
MAKLWPQILFGLVMLAIGSAALLFPNELRTLAERILGAKAPLVKWVNPSHVVPSIRTGGILGILIGLFVLWATWK